MRPPSGTGLNSRPRRWPHRNAPEQIFERQARVQALPYWQATHDFVFDWPRPAADFVPLVESLTAHMVLPVSIVGPLRVDLGAYAFNAGTGRLSEVARREEELYVPLVHSEGGLAASLQRGMLAVADAGTAIRTYVVHDRMTRDSCFLFDSTGQAVAFAGWVNAHADAMRAWLHDPENPLYAERVGGVARLSTHARLWEVDTHVVGPACHLLYRYTTGEASGLNMVTRNSHALNTEFVAPRFRRETGIRPRRVLLEANMGGDKKPSAQYFVAGGHGKTVLAEVRLPERTLKSVLRTSTADLVALEHLGGHGSHASQMQSVAFTPASIVAALFAATGQDLGMVGTSSMAHDVLEPLTGSGGADSGGVGPDDADAVNDGDAARGGEAGRSGDAGVHLSIRFAGLEVGTVGGGSVMPHAQAFLSLLGCTGAGSAQRLAQIIAATALCLELSAAASAATSNSENFAQAHLRQSGRA
jgi:hydroxymethylglutaryl-CoA reductase (NADPH)